MRIVELASGVSRRVAAMDLTGTAAAALRLLMRGIACRAAPVKKHPEDAISPDIFDIPAWRCA